MERKARRIVTEHERLRRAAGYTVTQFAAAIGFSHAYVSRLEAGQVKPSKEYRQKAARVLRVPEKMLFGDLED